MYYIFLLQIYNIFYNYKKIENKNIYIFINRNYFKYE